MQSFKSFSEAFRRPYPGHKARWGDDTSFSKRVGKKDEPKGEPDSHKQSPVWDKIDANMKEREKEWKSLWDKINKKDK